MSVLDDVPTVLTLTHRDDAFCFYVGQEVARSHWPSWWRRAVRWVKRVVLRRKPSPTVVLVVKAIDHRAGIVTLEPR